jgi:uncharacterized protein (DUF1697 family)
LNRNSPPAALAGTLADMHTHLALLRGINVGGKHMLPMKTLTRLIESLGGIDVATYIQSGNVVFRHPRKSASRLAVEIEAAIQHDRGFRPEVLMLTPSALDATIRGNPFPDAVSEPNTLHVTFLSSTPEQPDLAALEALRSVRERFLLDGSVFYLHAPDGIGRSKLATRVEKALGVSGTTRNWRTVGALRALADRCAKGVRR